MTSARSEAALIDAITAKGDLIAGSAAQTPTTVSVGANGQTLVASSGTSNGVAWQYNYNSFNAQTGTSYTLALSDAARTFVTASNASAITVTVPPSVFSAGQTIDIQQIGAGQVTFAAGSGVTITSTGATTAAPKLRAQYSAATVICTGSNTFTILGDVA